MAATFQVSGRKIETPPSDNKYMEMFMNKLRTQGPKKKYNLFSNMTAYISSGTVQLSAYHLAKIFMLYGGQHRRFMQRGQVTHWFTTRLAYCKEKSMQKSSIVVLKPEYIIDCCEANKLLPYDEYLILKKEETSGIQKFFTKGKKMPAPPSKTLPRICFCPIHRKKTPFKLRYRLMTDL
ncbi:MAG: hypothetical protein EZS28_027797 [Streblomastix strix]|uniref:BRCT domain-containing protein n=1 Tax=Streblomastix strix TaxID=222440 RepID=A0A5J4V136_9EUKA|nr:MAG: hypothetical protein EZS28_027797 [Streblomastix strix]